MADPSIEMVLKAVDPDVLEAYISAVGALHIYVCIILTTLILKHFPAAMIGLGYYTAQNAATWLNVSEFMLFAAQYHQTKKSRSRASSEHSELVPAVTSQSSSSVAGFSSSPMSFNATEGSPKASMLTAAHKKRKIWDSASESDR